MGKKSGTSYGDDDGWDADDDFQLPASLEHAANSVEELDETHQGGRHKGGMVGIGGQGGGGSKAKDFGLHAPVEREDAKERSSMLGFGLNDIFNRAEGATGGGSRKTTSNVPTRGRPIFSGPVASRMMTNPSKNKAPLDIGKCVLALVFIET